MILHIGVIIFKKIYIFSLLLYENLIQIYITLLIINIANHIVDIEVYSIQTTTSVKNTLQ